jgi:phosphate transport system permease protein
MSGVPSIVAGLFVYTTFVDATGSFSALAGAFALSILMLPTVARTSEEVLKLVPDDLRSAGYALGARQWRSTLLIVLPTVRSGLITAGLLGVARVIGETAPIVVLGAGTVLFDPKASPINFGALFSGRFGDVFTDTLWSNDNFFSVLPYQIYECVGDPKAEFQTLASAGIVVLLVLVLGMNLIAIFLRNKVS